MRQSQENIQALEQQQLLQQHLTPLQLQVVRMLEMPVAQFEDNVLQEIDNNPSLEAESGSQDSADDVQGAADTSTDADSDGDNNDYGDALNDALDQMGRDDRMEDNTWSSSGSDTSTDFQDASEKSFADTLTDQMNVEELTPTQKQIMEYIIGSLDDDGLLRKDLDVMNDELAIYNNLFVSKAEIEEVLDIVQGFDPAGVGARSLQECLLIQIERMKATPVTMMLYRIINECYDDFTHNRWQAICRKLNITEDYADELRHEIRHRLNPKPGSALGESQSRSMQQITPDFIVHVDYDGNISFELNNGRVPQIHVIKEDEMFLSSLGGMPKNAKTDAAYEFVRRNVDRAQMYIDAIRQRNETMTMTMKAIIDLQRPFFLGGDESELRPMVLKDVAERTGYDLSTISRVSRSKYVQTPWGTFQLRHFFSEGYTSGSGETTSTKVIKAALRDIILNEDKKHPLSDDKLVAVMAERGYPIARRTIAKYREQIGLPIARLRKK